LGQDPQVDLHRLDANLDPDPDLGRDKNENSNPDPDGNRNDADPQHLDVNFFSKFYPIPIPVINIIFHEKKIVSFSSFFIYFIIGDSRNRSIDPEEF
jgi:hypothetical protein